MPRLERLPNSVLTFDADDVSVQLFAALWAIRIE